MAKDDVARDRAPYEAPLLLHLQVPESALAGCVTGPQAQQLTCNPGFGATSNCSGAGSGVALTVCELGSSLSG
jgi:hypothetical protein